MAERAPGGAFGPPARVAALQDPLAARARAALGADGRAFVAWTGIATGGIHLVTRAPGGAFTAPTTLAKPDRTMLDDLFLNEQFGGVSGGLGRWDFGGADLSAALAPDGRAVLAWTDPREPPQTAALALQTFDGSPAVVHTVGGLAERESRPHPVPGGRHTGPHLRRWLHALELPAAAGRRRRGRARAGPPPRPGAAPRVIDPGRRLRPASGCPSNAAARAS